MRSMNRPSSAVPEAVARLFPDEDYQLTHNQLLDKNCMHIENLGGEISAPEIQTRRLIIGCFPGKFQGCEAAFARMVTLRRRMAEGRVRQKAT
jgi:kynurenine formamidase